MCRSTDNRSTKDRVALKALSTNIKKASPASPSRKRTFRQRRVSFSNEENHTSSPSPVVEITPEHTSTMWYSKNDIRSFQMEIKSFVMGQTTAEETYGMERYNFERRRQKKSAISQIVLSQKVKKDPEFQNYISRHQTSAFKEMALNQALENFCDVYDPLSALLEGGDNNDLFCNKDISFNMAMIDQSC